MTNEQISQILELIKTASANELRALEHTIFEKRWALEKAEEKRMKEISDQLNRGE